MKRFEKGDTTSQEPPPFHPFNVQDDCGIMWGILEAAGNPNAYDITTWDPNVDQVTFSSEEFFNRDEVKEAIHAPKDITWHGCRPGGGRRLLSAQTSMRDTPANQGSRRLYMDNDRPFSVVPFIAELLDDGIPVIVYNGDRDMTTNMVGSELALNEMSWSGAGQWLDAERGLWMVNDYPAGWAKEYNNLSFVVVYNSGHMVPYNRPVPAYDLLLRLLRHEKFVDKASPNIRISPIGGVIPTVGADATAWTTSTSMESTYGNAGIAIVSLILGAALALIAMRLSPTGRCGRKRGEYEEVDGGNISFHSSQ